MTTVTSGKKIKSSKSDKTMAEVTGTLVVQFPAASDESAWDIAAFERAIDQTDVLRRVGPATTERGERFIELRCSVKYGPVFGAYKSDLQRQVDAITQSFQDAQTAVFDCKRRELTTTE